MREFTRIVTVEITAIDMVDDNSELLSKGEVEELFTDALRDFEIDDLKVVRVQDFVREVVE